MASSAMGSTRLRASALDRAMVEVRRGLLLVGVFSFGLNVLVLVSPIYMWNVYDRVLASGHIETLVALTLAATLALAVYGALDAIRGRILMRISTWLDRTLGGTLLTASVDETLAGQSIGAQALRDLGQVRGFINSAGIFPLFDAPYAPLFIFACFLLHPWIGILAVVSSIILFALAIVNEMSTHTPLNKANQLNVAALRQSETALRNAEVVRAMGMLPAMTARWRKDNEATLALHTLAGDRGTLLMGFSKFFRMIVQILILGLGAYLVLQGQMSSGGMIAGSILLGRALAPVEQAIGAWKGFVGARASYDRLKTILERNPERPPAMRLPPPQGRLTLDRLTFVPPGSNRPVLKSVSFEIQPGEVLGIVGPSASGKSTLCRLVVGVWPPSSGHVRLDGAEIGAWDRTEFGRHVGYLPQDVELFGGTIRDNIARMGEATDEEVIAAAQLAGVHEMILHLPNAYQTEIGASGAVLSGGQRQRVGLARALFGRPRMVVLDEPNANLDQAGDAALLAAIEQLKLMGTTVVMVAHRPSLLSHVDKLLLMRDGAAELFGPRDVVLPRITGPRVATGQPSPQPQPQQPRVTAATGSA